MKKGTHPIVQDLDKTFPLRDTTTLRNLKTVASCLAHWCKAFGQSFENNAKTFLPTLAFPFIKLYPNNAITAFETIASILLNQCQLWFEFSPLEPMNYLGLIENLLTHFDPALIKYYKAKKVTTSTYAWYTLRTVYTEVLDEQQWYQLWDNVVSNPSWFLLFSIVAYNMIQRTVIMRLTSLSMIEKFFSEQNGIVMKSFVKKIYWLMEHCPVHLHPKKYMHEFEPLQNDQYQKLLNYPKILANTRNEHIDQLKRENTMMNKKLHELEKMEMALVDRLTNGWRKGEHERRMKKVEKSYEEALLREEQRLAYQRKQLILYQRLLRDRDSQILDAVRSEKHEQIICQRQDELSNFLRDLERQVCIVFFMSSFGG